MTRTHVVDEAAALGAVDLGLADDLGAVVWG